MFRTQLPVWCYILVGTSSSPSDNERADPQNEFSYVHNLDDNYSESTFLYSRGSSLLDIDTSQLESNGLKIWYTHADSYLDKREDMLVEIELQNTDIIVISDLFSKKVKATDINLE